MSENLLAVEERKNIGKNNAKRLRKSGIIPGIFYAHNEKSVPIQMAAREIMKILTSEGGLVDVKVGDKKKRKAIIKETQIDPLKQTLFHVDILGVSLKEKINVDVPIRVIGEAVGVKEDGGILHQYLREVEVSCLPLNIPEHIDVDVSQLNIGDNITIEQITVENATFNLDPDQLVVSILAPTVAEKPKEEVEEGEIAEEGEESEEN